MVWQPGDGFALTFGTFAIPFLLPEGVPLDKVVLCYTSDGDRTVDEAHLGQARERWEAENAGRRLLGKPPLEAHPLFRPVRVNSSAGKVVIDAGVTTYFANFSLQAPSLEWDAGRIVGAGMSVVPVCRDGHILLGKRSGVVASGEGKYHVAAGHAHPTSDFLSAPATLAGAAFQELEEEMHLHPIDIEQMRFLALALDLTASKPEFILEAALKPDSTAYLSRWNADVSKLDQEEANLEEFTELERLAVLLEAETASTAREEEVSFGLAAFWAIREKLVPACQAALMAYWLCHRSRGIEEFRSSLW